MENGEIRTLRFFAKRAGHGSPSIHPTPRKFFPRLRAFDDDGGWRRWRRGRWKREGVDLSCQTLAPRGGAPSLPPRLPTRTPRCPIEIAGFGVVSLCPLHLPSLHSAHPLRASTLHLALLALHLVHRPREPPAAVLRFTLARFRTLGGWLSKLSFETCTFVALTRSLARRALTF